MIADRLGMSVAQAQREISSREFVEWQAHLQLRHEQGTGRKTISFDEFKAELSARQKK